MAGLDGEDPARPPPAGKGVVWGVIKDTASQETLFDAQVSAVGTKYKAIADVDGRYRLELPPGNYELRVWYEMHKAQRVQNVQVTAGKVVQLDIGLDPDGQAVEVIEIETEADRGSVASQLIIRKNAATVGDAISSQEIAKTPDRNAADAAKRVVGTTIVDNKYVYVRGLGDRYSNSLLNGVPLPSPEPNRQAVPLDLFPTLVLSDITIIKTLTPDMPGDFAGGSVQINTRQLPNKFLLQGSLSLGINSQTTFSERLTYPGSSTDWLGIDSGIRALPEEIPDYQVRRRGAKPDGTTITSEELTLYGQKMNAYMSTRRSFTPPNGSGNIVVGDTLKLGPSAGNLGYIAALSYGRSFNRRPDEIIRAYDLDPTGAQPVDITTELGVDKVSWGGIGSATWNPSNDHRVTLTAFHTRSSDNEARQTLDGASKRGDDQVRETRLRFISRAFSFAQLSGEHRFGALAKGTLGWSGSYAIAAVDEPDSRGTTYFGNPDGTYAWQQGTLSGAHLFIDQADRVYNGAVSYTQPIVEGDTPTRMKLGAMATTRRRDLDVRRFRFVQLEPRPADPNYARQEPDQLFSNANIGTNIRLDEYTFPDDLSSAEQDVFAGYLMTDASLTRWLRLIGGARVESTRQRVDFTNRFDSDSVRPSFERSNVDLLPAVNFVVKATPTANLRVSLSRTLARPQLREITEVIYDDLITSRTFVGNKDVERARILNADLRYEFFPATGEVAAISVFYKNFEKPIEQTIDNNNTFSVANAQGAQNAGVELELRKTLGFASDSLSDFSFIGNFTLVYSRVELDRSEIGQAQLTTDARPLQGQSPFAVNLGLDYSRDASGTRARLLYNVFGSRVALAGRNGLEDVYEQPRHQIDVTVAQRVGEHVDLKLSAENILNYPVRFFQGEDEQGNDKIFNEYRTGATFTLGATLSY